MNNYILWVWLKLALDDSSIKLYQLYKNFNSISELYNTIENTDLSKFGNLRENEIQALKNKDLTNARKIVEICEINNIKMVSIEDDNYPEFLREITYPPCLLFYYGRYEHAMSKPRLTIVGTRECTTYGEVVTASFSSALAASGFTIVSGVAKGIDYIAAESALKADGSLILIIPCGILSADFYLKYRFKNIKNNGVIISEHLPYYKTRKYSYQERNRLLSGISEGCLVTQAPFKSGAVITANYALNQGKDVFAVMANIDIEQSAGSNQLIKDGAYPTASYSDIIDFYMPKYSDKINKIKKCDPATLYNSYQPEENDLEKIMNYKRDIYPHLDDIEREILEIIDTTEITSMRIYESTRFGISEILGALSSLEAKGIIEKLPGDKFKLIIM